MFANRMKYKIVRNVHQAEEITEPKGATIFNSQTDWKSKDQ